MQFSYKDVVWAVICLCSAGSGRPATLMQGGAKQVYSALVLLSACLMLGATICSQCNLTFLEI